MEILDIILFIELLSVVGLPKNMLTLANTSPLSYLLCLTRCSRQHGAVGGEGIEGTVGEDTDDVPPQVDRSSVAPDLGEHVNVRPHHVREVSLLSFS